MANTQTSTRTDTTTFPDDLVDQETAASMFHRSKNTIRDWRRQGKIKGYRGHDGKVLVSIDECNRCMAQTSGVALAKETNPAKHIDKVSTDITPTPPSDTPLRHPSPSTQEMTLRVYERFVANLEEQVTKLEREKNGVSIENKNLLEELREKEKRIHALERELYQAPKALLAEENPVTEEQRERESVSFSPFKIRDRAFGAYDHFNKFFGRD